MRRDNLFWGFVLILLGGFFLLERLGYIANVWGWFWPTLLVLLGLWIILGVYFQPKLGFWGGGTFEIGLQEAAEASVKFNHGAGIVNIAAGAPAGLLMVGSSGLAMSHSSHLAGDRLEVSVDAGPTFIPFIGPANGVWEFQMTPDVPIRMDIDAGASSLKIDLAELNVPFLDLDTGASSTTLTLPSRGGTDVDIDAGAASIDIRVPAGVSARIVIDEGATALDIDETRFPRTGGLVFESTDFNQAERRSTIKIDAGAGRITIR